MFCRRSVPAVVKTASAAPLLHQRCHDHDRWYGHALELDSHNYKFTGEPPSWMKLRVRTEEETNFAKTVLPHIDFASSYECLLFDADRLHPVLNRKEFGNEIKYRLEKQANTVARAQQLIKNQTATKAIASNIADDLKVENTLIARIFDEEHVQSEMKYVKCIRANELAEDNRLDILPGGSPNSLREKTRWNVNTELHPADRAEISARLTAWLPEKYHIVYFDDFQTVAANDSTARQEMMTILDNVTEEYAAEAKQSGFTNDLEETVAELRDEVDPTRAITTNAINACSDLDQLEAWAHQVHEYNGDSRILDIYARAAELTKNAHHSALVEDMRSWMNLATKQ